MKELFSIKAREQTYRLVIIAVLVVSAVVSLASLAYAHRSIQESKKNIYILENSQALVKAQATDITNSYNILARSAVERINKLLYQQVPDVNNLNKQLHEATTMSDRSVANVIDALKTHDYYDNILAQNFYTLLLTDSIVIDYSINPHRFVFWGTLKIVRGSLSQDRNIITSGYVEQMANGVATENNITGFLIRQLKIENDTQR